MVGGNGFARRGQALLVGVGIGVVDAFGDRALQVFRRTEAERARVADVELDLLAPLGLELTRAPGQFATNLVTDFRQALAGSQCGGGHG